MKDWEMPYLPILLQSLINVRENLNHSEYLHLSDVLKQDFHRHSKSSFVSRIVFGVICNFNSLMR